jgi:hypothetical protein
VCCVLFAVCCFLVGLLCHCTLVVLSAKGNKPCALSVRQCHRSPPLALSRFQMC